KPEGTASIVDLQIELTAASPQRRESGDFRCQMDTVGILVCYNGSWVKKDNIESYEGGEAKGIIVSRNYNTDVMASKVTPLVASLKNIEGHGIEGCNGIVSVERVAMLLLPLLWNEEMWQFRAQ
ncbi:hypothetical protein Prudu_016691, partial [Prunus dulcis]